MNVIGLLYLLLTFVFCFVFTLCIRLAIFGFIALRQKSKEKPEEPKPEEPKPQPVYYIVEKKRSKNSYGKPKEIHFDKK